MMLKKNQYQVSEKNRSHKVSHINTISKIKKSKEDLQTSFVSNSFSPLHVSFSVLIVIPPNLRNNRTILSLITGYNSCSWDYHYINIFPHNFRPLEKIGRGGGLVYGRYPPFLTSKYTFPSFIPDTSSSLHLKWGCPHPPSHNYPRFTPLSNCKHVRSHIGVIPLLFISCKFTSPGEKFHTQKVWTLTNMEHMPWILSLDNLCLLHKVHPNLRIPVWALSFVTYYPTWQDNNEEFAV